MTSRVSQLRCKEVVNVRNGSRYGYLGDVELDMDSGRVLALVVPGRRRLLGLLGREPETVLSWEDVERIGEDIILVRAGRERKNRRNTTERET